ncbi:MAG: hypothetical protein QOI31_268 [Solirubrobacterales bacterium]|jgi:diguanylate cyclase (GGDEF)-like protein|nr:hypothetical protein [Solirubrobacterales bacterium]
MLSPNWRLAPILVGTLGVVAYAVWMLMGEPRSSVPAMNWIYNGVVLMTSAACFVQSFRKGVSSVAWIAFGIGLLAWALGNFYYTDVLQGTEEIPFPSWADFGYLAAIPCFFVGIGLLIRQRVGRFTAAQWFDGMIGALAAAAVATALLSPALVGLTKGDPSAVLTNLAYPLGDLLLVSFVVGALAVSGFRGAGALVAVGAGLLIWSLGDAFYLYQVATDTYNGGIIDLGWPIGALVIAFGAYRSTSSPLGQRLGYRSAILLPVGFGLLAAAVLAWDHYSELSGASVWLAEATILAVLVRLGMSFRENNRLVAELHDDSITDVLTGLGNRRGLSITLGRVLAREGHDPMPYFFALLDLDGFKFYNDSFGHPAGDLLLRRLGENLSNDVPLDDSVFRLGGDEFCVLMPLAGKNPATVAECARTALSEQGAGFAVTASCGWAVLPKEADSASEALGLVDQRMYAEKANRTMRGTTQMQEIFRRIFKQHDPYLKEHFDEVARLAMAVGVELGLGYEEIDVIGRAAEFHDIGKVAIPQEILDRPGPLSESEWDLMRRHTMIGYKILNATPAMRPVATLVRSSHERWDGRGYPDGLVGEMAPLGARIVSICDAFDAMTSKRPYSEALSRREALAELRACAGTQFDPDLVEVFCAIEGRAPIEPAPAGSLN